MLNKLYKKDTIENLKMFSDLQTQEEYSNRSKELNSLFKEFSFSRFYNNLKNYNEKLKSININSFYSISSNNRRRKSNKEFDISKIKLAIEKMKKKENILKAKREKPYTERCLYSNPIYTLLKDKIKKRKKEEMKNKKKDKNKILSNPEVGRYNPLYETINRHTYEALFSFKNYNEYNNYYKNKIIAKLDRKIFDKRNNKNKIRSKTISALTFEEKNTILTERDRDDESKEKNEKNKINNIFYNTAVTKKPKNLFEERNINSNNHCLKFETYTSRKPLINKIFYKTDYNSQMNSISSPKYIKGSVEFNKVSSNKYDKNYFEKLINQKKDIPSLGFYRPNYSLVTDKPKNIFFNGRQNGKNNVKFMKLKKILGSYYVRNEYELFNLLNNNNIEDSNRDNFK